MDVRGLSAVISEVNLFPQYVCLNKISPEKPLAGLAGDKKDLLHCCNNMNENIRSGCAVSSVGSGISSVIPRNQELSRATKIDAEDLKARVSFHPNAH